MSVATASPAPILNFTDSAANKVNWYRLHRRARRIAICYS